jgi:hypothetical protein
VGAVCLELVNQPVAFFHRSHSPVALRHCSSDGRNPADVTGSRGRNRMFGIPIQQGRLKITGGQQSC